MLSMYRYGKYLTTFGTFLGGFAFIWATLRRFVAQLLPEKYMAGIVSCFDPFVSIEIKFDEFSSHNIRNEAFTAIQNYLSSLNTTLVLRPKKLKANDTNGNKSLTLCMDHDQEVSDTFAGVKVWWELHKVADKGNHKNYYGLTFQRCYWELINNEYIHNVIDTGNSIALANKKPILFTNCKNSRSWLKVPFEHPGTFDTLAMEPNKKEEIKEDLMTFKTGKDYYARIGKPWKRGYLLYGPPGTGKSTMIAAMANFLDYDVYDIELTTIKDNTELRMLLVDTSSRCIIVMEDVDCSLDLTGERNKVDKEPKETRKEGGGQGAKKETVQGVTLSGLLNFIDGLWSSCGSERIIIFTTNHVDKLDPALIRRGRMDKHIEMSYCNFEAFKVLSNNYLQIEFHELYGEVERLLKETDMTPADVAENLMPKSNGQKAETCLQNLIMALKERAEKDKAEKDKAEKKKEKKKAEEDKVWEEEARRIKQNNEDKASEVQGRNKKDSGSGFFARLIRKKKLNFKQQGRRSLSAVEPS